MTEHVTVYEGSAEIPTIGTQTTRVLYHVPSQTYSIEQRDSGFATYTKDRVVFGAGVLDALKNHAGMCATARALVNRPVKA